MRVPVATYRLQLGTDGTFDDVAGRLGYLEDLGVDTLYLSPIFENAGGGGYHVTDPNAISEAYGGEDGFRRLAEACAERGFGIVLDIVPNHLSTASPMWRDVLAHGQDSRYARWFDVDWDKHSGKILVPTLEEPGEPVEEGAAIRAWWRDAIADLSYRRFFDINDLVGVRQEDPAVFDETHDLTLRLVREGLVTGLRVDHVDGLRDPKGYLERLRAAAPETYLLVEKIVAHDEDLRPEWPVEGTTGYEVAEAITAVLTDRAGAERCDAFAARFTGDPTPWEEVVVEAKRRVLDDLFPGEVRALANSFPGGSLSEEAIVEVTVALSVYRTYLDGAPASEEDRGRIARALAAARLAPDDARRLREVFLDTAAHLDWIARWQQLTGPAMAKGLEDTALYRHLGLVSRNMVGGEPGDPPLPIDGFHAVMATRAARWPLAMSSTTTHDSKRSEDVRAGIAVLSEVPDAWERGVEAWQSHLPVTQLPTHVAPTPRERLLLFQTLLGTWPESGDEDYVERIQEHLVKAAREAKLQSSWLDPDEEHERALGEAVAGLLADEAFREAFDGFREALEPAAHANALAQVLLRCTVPGVPDLYRGTESWYRRLVDPDNRAPAAFTNLGRAEDDKRRVTAAALRFRRANPDLFLAGAYEPLEVRGMRAGHAVAFARRHDHRCAIAIAPRLVASLGPAPLGEAWADTAVALPPDGPTELTEVLTGSRHAARGELLLRDVLTELPVALLAG